MAGIFELTGSRYAPRLVLLLMLAQVPALAHGAEIGIAARDLELLHRALQEVLERNEGEGAIRAQGHQVMHILVQDELDISARVIFFRELLSPQR